MKKSLILITVFAVSFAFLAFGSQAMAENTKIKGKLIAPTKASTTATSTRQNATSTKCQKTAEKIDQKVANFENGQSRRISAYNNMKARLLKVVERLTAKGVETADLKADLVMLDQKIKKLSDDYVLYLSEFKQTRTQACGTDGQFKARLNKSKNLLSQVKNDVLDIKSFYSKTIKPDLKSAQAELKKINVSSTPATSTSTEASIN